jgi:hypothetical protein
MVKIPSMIGMFGPWFAFFVAINLDASRGVGVKGLWRFLPSFLGGFILGWLIWSIQVPHWRLWAYQRVADIDELKWSAVAAQILWPEGHVFQKTEIMSRTLRAKLKAFEERGHNKPLHATGQSGR